MIEDFRFKAGLPAKQLPTEGAANPVKDLMKQKFYDEFRALKQTAGKAARADQIKALRDRIFDTFVPEGGTSEHTPEQVAQAFESLEERIVRDLILEGKRIDGRAPRGVRLRIDMRLRSRGWRPIAQSMEPAFARGTPSTIAR